MNRELVVKCQKCGHIMEESKHKHFPNKSSNIFKAKCINIDCSEFSKIHVMMETVLYKEQL